jgi:transcriptional/translational regulatory protein YebC/TACO1
MFAARGIVEVDAGRLDEDALTERALVDGVIDVRYAGAGEPAEVVTEPTALMAVKDALEGAGLSVRSAQLAMEATQTTRPAGADAEKVLTFLDALEEHEDVQNVYSNADFDEAQLEALA